MDKEASKQAANSCITRLHSISLTAEDGWRIIQEVFIHLKKADADELKVEIIDGIRSAPVKAEYPKIIKKTSAMGPTMAMVRCTTWLKKYTEQP